MTEALYRSFAPELEIRAASKGGDGRTVDGIAVPFGRPVRIHDGLTEQFARGVANHQLKAAHRIKFARDHLSLGGILLGRALELRDDAAGLWGSFRVSRTAAGDETLTLIEDGALDELSVGFFERRGGSRALEDGTIERTKADFFEVAAVPFGAYGQGAKIKGTRSAEEDELAAVEREFVEHEQVVIPEQRTAERERLARARQILAGLPVLPPI
jgi:HK97 family phage prohead protease